MNRIEIIAQSARLLSNGSWEFSDVTVNVIPDLSGVDKLSKVELCEECRDLFDDECEEDEDEEVDPEIAQMEQFDRDFDEFCEMEQAALREEEAKRGPAPAWEIVKANLTRLRMPDPEDEIICRLAEQESDESGSTDESS